ncbi:MAG: bile acid:sodium symporter [Deltaproteobacteria bacterium]|nr:bile acid:sodium symporter [Deltaproteobacteria bacterium]
MFRIKDLVLLVVAFSSMLLGVLLPGWVGVFRPFPLYCMMSILFLSFLSIRIADVWKTARGASPKIAFFLFLKLVLLPAATYLVFRFFCPTYALAAFLLSGISSGVVAPFFADLLKADRPLVLVMVVLSSLLVPFTLPPLVSLFFGREMDLSLAAMMRLLLLVVFVPVCLVEVTRRLAPGLVGVLRRWQYPLTLVIFAVANMGIFSGYAEFFFRSPMTILAAFLVSLALAGFYFAAGLLFTWGRPLEDQLSAVICFGTMNNVLVLIFSAQFFGPIEPTLAALYTVPFFGLILPLRAYRDLRLKRGHGSPPLDKGGCLLQENHLKTPFYDRKPRTLSSPLPPVDSFARPPQ